MRLAARDRAARAVVAALLLGEPGCSREPKNPGTSPSREEARTVAKEVPATAPAGAGINEVLRYWSDGQADDAVQSLLELVDNRADAAAYRPFPISEQQFVALAPAERDALRDQMLTTVKHMAALARELARRAREAHRAGDFAGAARHLDAMKQLGMANREPEVPKLVDLVGQAIVKRADGVLSELAREEPGGGPQP